jgi:hypothetical protein
LTQNTALLKITRRARANPGIKVGLWGPQCVQGKAMVGAQGVKPLEAPRFQRFRIGLKSYLPRSRFYYISVIIGKSGEGGGTNLASAFKLCRIETLKGTIKIITKSKKEIIFSGV